MAGPPGSICHRHASPRTALPLRARCLNAASRNAPEIASQNMFENVGRAGRQIGYARRWRELGDLAALQHCGKRRTGRHKAAAAAVKPNLSPSPLSSAFHAISGIPPNGSDKSRGRSRRQDDRLFICDHNNDKLLGRRIPSEINEKVMPATFAARHAAGCLALTCEITVPAGEMTTHDAAGPSAACRRAGAPPRKPARWRKVADACGSASRLRTRRLRTTRPTVSPEPAAACRTGRAARPDRRGDRALRKGRSGQAVL
jgi:hypothetical protein